MMPEGSSEYVWGFDLGTDSIGWAVTQIDSAGRPYALARLGVRRFEAGVVGSIEAGRDEPPNTERRTARQQRRQLWRRAYRMTKLYKLLARCGLLPSGAEQPDQRHQMFLNLDKQFSQRYTSDSDRQAAQVVPYRLRAIALERKLEPFELGRALYHLAQRRGYRGSLKGQRDEEETGRVKSDISELDQLLQGRTLGEYFATLDPEETRIRGRYTSRRMYQEEFDRIWRFQSEQHPMILTPTLRDEIEVAIFWQRPLKSQSRLIGRCELEPSQRRAPLACSPFQEYRLLQKVNDLQILAPDGEIRALTPAERSIVIAALHRDGDLTWAAVRRHLRLKGPRGEFRGYTFNFEEGGDSKLVGNRTAARLRQVLGDRWQFLAAAEQERLVDEILSFDNETALSNRLQNAWEFAPDEAAAVAGARLEQGYASHSRRALARLLPAMRAGEQYAIVRAQVYGDRATPAPLDRLPPVQNTGYDRQADVRSTTPRLGRIRNPAVARALSELRKVVGALLQRYGKPRMIRVELARDLKRSRKSRQRIANLNRANEN